MLLSFFQQKRSMKVDWSGGKVDSVGFDPAINPSLYKLNATWPEALGQKIYGTNWFQILPQVLWSILLKLTWTQKKSTFSFWILTAYNSYQGKVLKKEKEMVAAPFLCPCTAACNCNSRWEKPWMITENKPRRSNIQNTPSSSSCAIRRGGQCPQIMELFFSGSSDTQPFPWDLMIITRYSWHMPTTIGWFLQLHYQKAYSSFMKIFSIHN